jgi:hypothetical protein
MTTVPDPRRYNVPASNGLAAFIPDGNTRWHASRSKLICLAEDRLRLQRKTVHVNVRSVPNSLQKIVKEQTSVFASVMLKEGLAANTRDMGSYQCAATRSKA